jgi:hypothetical protein
VYRLASVNRCLTCIKITTCSYVVNSTIGTNLPNWWAEYEGEGHPPPPTSPFRPGIRCERIRARDFLRRNRTALSHSVNSAAIYLDVVPTWTRQPGNGVVGGGEKECEKAMTIQGLDTRDQRIIRCGAWRKTTGSSVSFETSCFRLRSGRSGEFL